MSNLQNVKQNAIGDVVAKMRRFADRHRMHPACQVVREFADMLDFALKRDCEVVVAKMETTTKESLAVGNAAKLREAVELALSLLDLGEDVPSKAVKREDIDFMKAALAEPARQCDVGTAEEQRIRYERFCNSKKACCECSLNGHVDCHFAWVQMPYTESEVVV